MRALLTAVLLAACGSGTASQPQPAPAPGSAALGSTHAEPAPTPIPRAPDVGGAGSAAGSATAAKTEPPAKPVTEQPKGADFVEDAKLMMRVAACQDVGKPMPEAFGDKSDKLAAIVKTHCKLVMDRMTRFQEVYFDKGRAWFDAVVPKDVPKTVVYPFGGGDLLSALVAFPEATEYTTISLEMAGDPRRLKTLSLDHISNSLGALRAEIGGLVSVGSNTSENLSHGQQNDLPSQVSSFLLGLVAGGYEPLSMRYFTLDPDTGDVHYLEQTEIDAMDAAAKKGRAKALKGDWLPPTFSPAFANVEIMFRKEGDANAPIKVHRHIGWNLSDDYLAKHGELLKHLEKKGNATYLTKGASYLLWSGNFARIRGFILDHLAWMLSDSTGIPPIYAKPAGMVQETYGYYHGAFLEGSQGTRADESFIALWAGQKARKLPFRFGYVDKDKQAHLVVTRPNK